MADVTADCASVISGPAVIDLAGDTLGHTQGGVTVTVEPQTRAVLVDAHGETPCKMIHLGDNMRVTANLAQWVLQVIKAAYMAGLDGTTYVGIGRAAGYVYTPLALKVTPLVTADAAKEVNVWKAVSVGALELNFNHNDDRLFTAEWQGLIDTTKTDGEKVGSILLSAAA